MVIKMNEEEKDKEVEEILEKEILPLEYHKKENIEHSTNNN